jgi:hypothetical protein
VKAQELGIVTSNMIPTQARTIDGSKLSVMGFQ